MAKTILILFSLQGQDIIDGLKSIGHNISIVNDYGFAAVTAIARNGTSISAAFDRRRSGSISYI